MTHDQQTKTQDRWAPWWVYLVVILPTNGLRASLVPDDGWPTMLMVAVAAAQAAVLFAVITVVYRLTRR